MLVTGICIGYRCMYWLQVFVLVTGVCAGYRCLYWLQVFVMVTSVCAGYKCLCWLQVFVHHEYREFLLVMLLCENICK